MKKCVEGKGVYQFRLDFRHINPPVWRCIQLPGTSTFWALAVALQSALGWPSVGLHEFIVQRLSPKRVERIAMFDEGFGDIVVRLSPHTRIADYFTLSRSVGYFHYPLGQEWYCQLTLEKIVRSDKHYTYPRCIGGERMAPVVFEKDSAKFARIARNPRHWRYRKTMRRLNQQCDREVFDKDSIIFTDPAIALDVFTTY